MEDRNYLEMAAIVAIGLVVLVAIVGATYLIFTSLAGTPHATPTPTPEPPYTPTPFMVIPAGPVTSTPAPSGNPAITTMPIATPAQPIIKTADLVDHGTDKDTYNRGDTAITYIVIKNTGTVPIDEATLNIKVEKYVSVVGYVKVQSPSTTLTDLNIQPGNTSREEYKITIPSDYEGVSTTGKYRFTIDVVVWGTQIGEFQKEVAVQ